MADKKEIKLYICPRCKDTRVKYTFNFKNLFGVIPMMKCDSCKLAAPNFPIVTVDKSKLEKVGKKTKKRTKKVAKRKVVKKTKRGGKKK